MGLGINMIESFDYPKGQYDTDLSNIAEGCYFPSPEVRRRNIIYKHNMKLYTGDYAKNKKLIARVNGTEREIDYKVLPLNYFKLIVNKIESLLFSNEITVRTGDIERDRIVNKLIEKTSWLNSIREGIKLCEIYGDCILKTYRDGVSVTHPKLGYKVLDKNNKSYTKLYVLKDIIYNEQRSVDGFTQCRPTHIRILISGHGFDFERVFEYNGDNNVGRIGKPVRYKYNDRWIPRSGRYYWTGFDTPTVQWLSVNTEADGVYGEAAFNNIKEIVFALENRLSMDNYILDAHGAPILLVGRSMVKEDEETGEYYISVINNQLMVDKTDNGEVKPSYITWDGHLDNSETVKDTLKSYFYELSEMGETFLAGKYQGNLSEESINNIIKGALDRGYREINSLYKQIRASLYVLCRLNEIEIDEGDLDIQFNIGRADDIKVLSEVCDILSTNKLFSKETLLCKFWGYTKEDAISEMERIRKEESSNDDARSNEEAVRDRQPGSGSSDGGNTEEG